MTSDNLAFDESFDWLMPVIEKIEILGFRVEMKTRKLKSPDASVWHSIEIFDNQFDFAGNEGYDKLKVWYEAVVEFVKWYNGRAN